MVKGQSYTIMKKMTANNQVSVKNSITAYSIREFFSKKKPLKFGFNLYFEVIDEVACISLTKCPTCSDSLGCYLTLDNGAEYYLELEDYGMKSNQEIVAELRERFSEELSDAFTPFAVQPYHTEQEKNAIGAFNLAHGDVEEALAILGRAYDERIEQGAMELKDKEVLLYLASNFIESIRSYRLAAA